MRDLLSQIPRNVFGLGIVGFFMQFGASLVYATGNVFVEDVLLSGYQLMLVRGFSESIPHIIKVFSGYLSDKIRNRKVFLMFGYGSMIFFKIIFFVCTFTWIFPVWFLSILFAVTQMCDRIMNCLRDGPRDALVVDSTPHHLLGISFGLRKSIAALGSIASGVFIFLLIKYTGITMTTTYFLAIIPVIISTLILYYMIKDVPWTEDAVEDPKDDKEFNWCLARRYALFAIVMTYISWGMSIYSLAFWVIYINSAIIAKEMNNSLKPWISMGIVGLVYFMGGLSDGSVISTVILGFFGLGAIFSVHQKTLMWSTVAALLYGLLITFDAIRPVIVLLFGVLLYVLVPYLQTTDTYEKLKNNSHHLKRFFYVLLMGVLLVMGRINDTVYFRELCNLGAPKIYTILLFVFYYTIITISSLVFGMLLQKKNYYVGAIFVFGGLIASNMLLGMGSYGSLIGATCCAAVYSGGLETVFTTLVSRTIPSKDLTATLFGLFYTLMGIFNFIGVTMFDFYMKNAYMFNIVGGSNNIQVASRLMIFAPLLGLILFFFINNKIHHHQDN